MSSDYESFKARHLARKAAEKAAQEDLQRTSSEYVQVAKDLDALVDRIARDRETLAKTTPFKGRAPRDHSKPIPLRSHEAVGLRLVPKARTTRILIR